MTQGTSRAARYAREVGELLGLSGERLGMLEAAAARHDAGKRFLSERIVDKPGELNDAEWMAMRRHPEFGEAIARVEGQPDEVADAVRHHHERLDGSGYPDRLSDEDLSLEARVLAVIDAYLGMTSLRRYRKALDPERALEELGGGAGTQFDPAVVDAFSQVIHRHLAR